MAVSRWRLFLLSGVILALAFAVWRLPIADTAIAFVAWIRDAGLTGVLVFAVVYVGATVALLPGSVLTLGAGFVYGPLLGTLIVSPVSVTAATLAFLLGRTGARQWIARRIAGVARFDAIDEAVGREGFKIVLLLRLSPLIPFTLLNYALGLTRVRPRDYVVASWIGMLPGTFLYVYLGSLLTSASQIARGTPAAEGPAARLLYWGGLVATVFVAWIVTRTARTALRQSLERAEPHRSAYRPEVSS